MQVKKLIKIVNLDLEIFTAKDLSKLLLEHVNPNMQIKVDHVLNDYEDSMLEIWEVIR